MVGEWTRECALGWGGFGQKSCWTKAPWCEEKKILLKTKWDVYRNMRRGEGYITAPSRASWLVVGKSVVLDIENALGTSLWDIESGDVQVGSIQIKMDTISNDGRKRKPLYEKHQNVSTLMTWLGVWSRVWEIKKILCRLMWCWNLVSGTHENCGKEWMRWFWEKEGALKSMVEPESSFAEQNKKVTKRFYGPWCRVWCTRLQNIVNLPLRVGGFIVSGYLKKKRSSHWTMGIRAVLSDPF